ncbi:MULTISPECIES: SDR family NAD(P)-dependent oxidoreductase [Thermoactinomyces]|jgi:3-oxoacyl-[acyl-carrier protein] reductase|uniref:SDR family NAD(P)-dependent oxidoreductase n=1 Tax=Thermoactinomyces TaxID=2023 RepID=UPI0006731EC4|nr:MULTISPECIES: SDR family oxidoreductase [Thermoactinomyces]KYQ87920.1 short-chain dehydrogenase [Thermoactinomyces sp. AS95]MBH8582389.1 SDR family oxidoreductase [Thermoactinomyces sp. CICC 10735]MBH8584815.1 SDR family oxidoreductase [Thermoactinomyces sp. CICC 10520]MBI0386371.1 SDR family oxidoreductase [Thermoactinomyces sp. CICC 24227]MBI0391155.1 SDR family oxidoreductase [Thermoactinomyces sp. CICC 24226]
MNLPLKGKVAVVTGASRGLGRMDALKLAEAGADVVVTDILIEEDEKLEEKSEQYGPMSQIMAQSKTIYTKSTAKQIEEMGRRSAAYRMDVTDREEVQKVMAEIKDRFGRIDILVNNAGTLDHTARLEHQNDDFWDRDLKVNLTGAYNCSKAVWPYMKEQKWGRIINMASVAGTLGGYGQASYSTTKAGILGLTKTLALEGARYNITSNAIVPGIINTEAFQYTNPKMRERMIERTAFKRPGEPEDIAYAIVFLASDQAKYITGVGLPVAGGIDLFTF